TYQRTRYLQPQVKGEIALSKTPDKPFVVSVSADDAQGRSLQYSDGVVLYDKGLAPIGFISSDGKKTIFDPSSVMHWMPEGELKPGMEWKIYNEYKGTAINYVSQCTTAERYNATSKKTFRDILINQKLTRVDAIEVTLKGRGFSVSSCELVDGEQDILQTIVYSKELNLILEQSKLRRSDYNEMIGKYNWLEVVTAIN
ncbi:MAG TPA: hypothetical protein VFW00_06235, partial [Rhodocyclaceae bacterium]|nr:hypothetical protein [Rhodocyclaceae bacterium]